MGISYQPQLVIIAGFLVGTLNSDVKVLVAKRHPTSWLANANHQRLANTPKGLPSRSFQEAQRGGEVFSSFQKNTHFLGRNRNQLSKLR